MTFYKSTIVIYSAFDPSKVELSTLALEAEGGEAICTSFDGGVTVELAEMPERAVSFFEIASGEGDYR